MKVHFGPSSGRRWTRHAAFGMESITQEVHALDVNQRYTGKRSKICASIMAATGPWQPPGLDLQKSGPLIMAAARPLQPPALDVQKLWPVSKDPELQATVWEKTIRSVRRAAETNRFTMTSR